MPLYSCLGHRAVRIDTCTYSPSHAFCSFSSSKIVRSPHFLCGGCFPTLLPTSLPALYPLNPLHLHHSLFLLFPYLLFPSTLSYFVFISTLAMDILKGVVVCGCFVGSFYTWTRERLFVQTAVRDLKEAAMNPSIYVDRNDTSAIRRRLFSFTVVTLASAAYLLRVAVMGESTTADLTTFSVAEQVRLGCKSVAVTSLLFGGVLLEQYVQGRLPSLRAYCRENPLHFARDLIICPVGEELFFRGVLFSVVRLRPLKTQIAATSLLFALAHAHHVCSFAADAYRDLASEHEDATLTTARDLEATSQKALTVRAWRVALARVGVLCAITSSFGVLSGLYYTCVCERSLVATTAAHVMCNAIGPPHFSFLRTGTSGAERRWRKWIAVAYFLGIAGSITLMLCTRT